MTSLTPRALMALATTLAAAPTCWAQSPPCITSGTPFQAAYAQQQLTPGAVDLETYDVKHHAYRFIPQVNMTVCSIGYTSPPTPPTHYRFRIIDINCTPGVVLDWNTTMPPIVGGAAGAFPPLGIPFTTHQAVPATALTAGCTYEIRRTALGFSNFAQTIGRLLTNQSAFLAGSASINTPALKILSSKLSGGGSSSVNQFLPFIDFGTY